MLHKKSTLFISVWENEFCSRCLNTAFILDEPEEVVQPHRPSDDPEIESTEPTNESTAANEKAENNSSMTSHNINLLEDVESPEIPSIVVAGEEKELPPLPPGNEFEETNFASLASHELSASPEDTTPFTSSVAHHLIPCHAEDYEVSMAVHQVEHEVSEKEEEEGEEELDKVADTSMVAHKLPEMEPKSEFLSLPVSLASHHLLPVEFPETGLLSSMVAHQIYQPYPENIEEAIPLTPSLDCESISATSAQELNEETFEDNLRENLKVWFMGVDFKATYGDIEETTFAEDSGENISMDYEVPMDVDQTEHEDEVIEENVEEIETELEDSNIAHKVPKTEEEEVEKEGDTSMASHKLSEVEPESEFLSLPASLASHLVLPVEWPETGLLPSMVAHQIFHPCPENLDQTVPLTPSLDFEASNPRLSKQEANEMERCMVEREENLRQDFEEWSKCVDFKATYCHLEEETTRAEDSNGTLLLMDEKDSVEIGPSEAEPELIHASSLDEDHTRENICEEVTDKFLTEETHIAEVASQESLMASMATHKEAEQDVAWEFVEPISSLAAHRLLPLDEVESGLTYSMVAHSLSLIHQDEDVKPEREDYAEPEAWASMVGHQVVGAEESDLPFVSMAAHQSFVPEWIEEGTVISGVSHQLLNQGEMEEDAVIEQDVPRKWEENVQEDAVFEPFISAADQIPVAEMEKDVSLPTGKLPNILEVEESSTEKHQERGVREAEVCRIRKAEIDPRRRNIDPASDLPKSPVGTSDDEKDSFENFINESKQTYHERVADEYKSTIKRIQDLHKLVEEEIGEFEKTRKDVKKSEVITVLSNVRGVSFPLEITINQTNQKEDSSLETEGMQGCQQEEENEEGVEEAMEESEHEGGDDNIISATCSLRENTPILITTNMDQVECDSGFEGSPDLKKTDGVRNLQMSLTDREAESPVSFPRQTLTTPKRSSVEEKKTRDKQLLESFLKNENHQQIKDKTTVTSNSGSRVTPEKKHVPKIPDIPIAQEPKEAKKQKNRKPKVTTTAFKDSIMKKTYKIRFHVNIKETEGEKPRSVLESFLSFFKDRSIFGKK